MVRIASLLRPVATLVQSATGSGQQQPSPSSPSGTPNMSTGSHARFHVLENEDSDEEDVVAAAGRTNKDRRNRPPSASESDGEGHDSLTIPLTAFRDDHADAHDPTDISGALPTPATRSNRRKSMPAKVVGSAFALLDRLPTRRVLAILIVIVGLYKISHYAGIRPSYSIVRTKLEEYSARYNPWHYGSRINWIDVAPVASVNGMRYRAHQEEEEDRYWAWKAIPYAQAPLGAKRFRVAVPIEQPNAGSKDKRAVEERVMDTWDDGCVRPRPREDRTDGPHEEFDGHEDCLK